MRIELLVVIIILSVITVSSLFLSIWNVFVTKKQTTFSATDFFFGLGLVPIAGSTNNIYIMLATTIIFIIWLIVIGIKCWKNQKKSKYVK